MDSKSYLAVFFASINQGYSTTAAGLEAVELAARLVSAQAFSSLGFCKLLPLLDSLRFSDWLSSSRLKSLNAFVGAV